MCCVAAQQCSVDTRGGGRDLLVWAAHGPRARRPPEAAPAAERRDWRELMLSSCVVTPGGARGAAFVKAGGTDRWRRELEGAGLGPGPGGRRQRGRGLLSGCQRGLAFAGAQRGCA